MALVLAGVLPACGAFKAGGAGGPGSPGEAGRGSRVERRELDHHPPINLVVRLGDPLPAVAFANAHDGGSIASVAISALILARLQTHGVANVVSVPNQAGVELAVLCADNAAATSFIRQVSAALATPVSEQDPALPVIAQHFAALRSRSFGGKAEALLADCSGDLGALPSAAVPDVRTAAGRSELEKYRQFAYAARASAFSALGPDAFVDAAATALGNVPEWPTGDAAEDVWPDADATAVDTTEGPRHLSVALRVPDADAALASVRMLTASDAALTSRLHSFLPGLTVERVAFQARPRGACLRVDVRMPEVDPAPSLKETAQAVSLVSEEMRAALGHSGFRGAVEDNIIEPSDPRQAAARAAWRALTGRQEPGVERRLIGLALHPAERGAFAGLASALADFDAQPSRAPLETRVRSEAGQGELWLLIGSPCGTLGESNDDAGQSALALTLAAHLQTNDVKLEPWLTPDAVGLLAHATRQPGESAQQQGERVARALGRALTERDAGGDALATAQGELFNAVGGAPRPGYARLLDALSPDHSAWLEPHGIFTSLAQANRDSVAARRRDLLRGPLRVAVLGNQDDTQAQDAARALERWLSPWRDDPRRCQATPERAAHTGELALAIPNSSNAESAYVGLPFPSRLKYEREAEAIALTLNGAQGGLARALNAEHISASAYASVIGGGRVAALVVEIHAGDEDAHKATLEVRRALEHVIQTPLSNEELAAAERAIEQRRLSASLDPRRRVVDLWRGAAPEPTLSRVSLRSFQAILASAAQVVISITHRE
ncbi:MAG: hypothetical protein ABJB12_12130 [Pseudomonadota bacterium]